MKYIIFLLSLGGIVSCSSNNTTQNKEASKKSLIIIPQKNERETVLVSKQTQKEVIKQNLNYDKYVKKKVNNLKDTVQYLQYYYNQFQVNKDSLSEVLFFDMFPTNFKSFKRIYGFNENGDNSPLAEKYEHIIDFRNSIKAVSLSNYYDKIYKIAIRGKWQADNVNHLQHIIRRDIEEILPEIKEYPEEELKHFWFFYFYGPHSVNEIPIQLKKQVDVKMLTIINESLNLVKLKWSED